MSFSTFCVGFLRCTDIFYYIILYVVREVVTGKKRNLQKSLEKVAILTKTRLKKCEIRQKSLEKIEWVQNSVEKSPAIFVYVLLSFVFMKTTD